MPLEANHRHCKVCGKVCATDQETCGPKCAAERERRVGSARTYRLLLYGTIGILLLVVLSSYLR